MKNHFRKFSKSEQRWCVLVYGMFFERRPTVACPLSLSQMMPKGEAVKSIELSKTPHLVLLDWALEWPRHKPSQPQSVFTHGSRAGSENGHTQLRVSGNRDDPSKDVEVEAWPRPVHRHWRMSQPRTCQFVAWYKSDNIPRFLGSDSQ